MILEHFEDLALRRDVFKENSTSNDYATNLGRRWYKDCQENHSICRESRALRGYALPSRLLDICPIDQAIDCCLHISAGELVPYACLSHCWGKDKVIKTEKESLALRKKEIRLDDMPRTFRDAVTIARNLGLRYLWIDSLCIIQDSELDWEIESANMDQIYMNAALTIAAVDAEGDTGGCFRSSPAALSGLCRTPMFDSIVSQMLGTSISNTFVQQKLHHVGGDKGYLQGGQMERIGRLAPVIYSYLGREFPLHRRAWTLQEQVLSVAMLSYERTEVRWSCATTSACECIPEGFDEKERFVKASQIMQDSSTTNPNEKDEQSSFRIYLMWNSLLELYTNRDMTYEKDRLTALAGLAKEMARAVQSEYLAGLWRNNLRADLAWFRQPRGTLWVGERDSASDYRAPSWSWASVNGAVRLRWPPTERQGPLLQLESEIVSCTVQHKGQVEFGAVTAGKLVLRGLLKNAIVSDKKKTNPNYKYPIFEGRLSIFDRSTMEEVGGFEPDDRTWAGNEIWCMPVLAAYLGMDRLSCLALTPTGVDGTGVDGDMPEFRRVGMIWMCHARKRFVSDGEVASAVSWFADTPVTTVAII